MNNDEVLLDVQHLTKSFVADTNFFGKPTSFVQAVDDVSFQIRRGEAFGLVGESGCGKTTIGKMLVGLLAPTSGTITFEGRDLTAMSPKERRRLCCDIQLIFQDPYASLNPPARTRFCPRTRSMPAWTSCSSSLAFRRPCVTATRTSSLAASASAWALRVRLP